jgi:hypothetical protein
MFLARCDNRVGAMGGVSWSGGNEGVVVNLSDVQ